jgi:hypothetical protein
MHDQDKKRKPRLLCIACGKQIVNGHYCSECADRGLGPCEACEGLPLADVEEASP